MRKIVTPAETQTVGGQFKGLRQSRGLSLRQLARAAGVSAVTLSRWEAGRNLPGTQELDAVLRELEANGVQKRLILRQMQTPRAVLQLPFARRHKRVHAARRGFVVGDASAQGLDTGRNRADGGGHASPGRSVGARRHVTESDGFTYAVLVPRCPTW